MLSRLEAMVYVDQLRLMKRFPREEGAVKALAALLAKHTADESHADLIVAEMIGTHSEWPGPAAIVEAARKTSVATARERSAAESQMAQWRREFKEHTEPNLCPDCNGNGIFQTHDGTVQACGCPEGRPRWVLGLPPVQGLMIPACGRNCRPDEPGAVLYNSGEWLERWNRALRKKPEIAALIGLKRKPAAEEKLPVMETAEVS